MEIGDHCALDWGALEEVAEAVRARGLIGDDTPWLRLFDMAYMPSYRVMACEFLSSFDYAPRPADRPEEDDDQDDPWIEVSFRLAGQWHLMSLRQFAEHSGLYRVEELDTPIYTDGIWMAPRTTLMRFWQVISQHRFGTTSKQRASYITDPLYRYLHKLIATSIAPREQSREWCTQGDLFYLYCLIWGERCALHRCLAQWFATAFHRQDRPVLYGGGGGGIHHTYRRLLGSCSPAGSVILGWGRGGAELVDPYYPDRHAHDA
ncbi:hypothetical protein HanRHA438_Chr02g0082341 [Helianthus annuus]|nr:hypothetical protein HanRHA438_Chr02g0082341 [Helianthus annuus]